MSVVKIPVGDHDSVYYLPQASLVCYNNMLYFPVDLSVAHSSAFLQYLAAHCEPVKVERLLHFISNLETLNIVCRFEEHGKKRHSFDWAILSPCKIFNYRNEPELLNSLLSSRDTLTIRVTHIQAWWRAWLRIRSRRLLALLAGQINADILHCIDRMF